MSQARKRTIEHFFTNEMLSYAPTEGFTLEVDDFVMEDFVIQGLDDDEWTEAYVVKVVHPLNSPPPFFDGIRRIHALATEFFLHRNIFVFVEVAANETDH